MALHPPGSDWTYLLDFYADLESHQGWSHIQGILQFVRALIGQVELSDYAHTTSHDALVVLPSNGGTLDDCPTIGIEATASDRIQLELEIPISSSGDTRRWTLERVNCPVDQAVSVFEELAMRLKSHN